MDYYSRQYAKMRNFECGDNLHLRISGLKKITDYIFLNKVIGFLISA